MASLRLNRLTLVLALVIGTFTAAGSDVLSASTTSTDGEPSAGRSLTQVLEGELPLTSDGWYERFHTYDEVVERAGQLEADPRVTLITLPRQTHEGQDIVGLRLAGQEGLSKRVVITGMLHAREWLAASATMLLAETVLKMMATDAELADLLRTFELVIIPVMNPDGLRYTFGADGQQCSSSFNCDRMWRKNCQPLAKSGCVGIDLNRAWPLDWGARGGEAMSEDTCREDYAGEYPLQPPEALALCELLAELHDRDPEELCGTGAVQHAADGWGTVTVPERGVVGFLDVHSYGQLLLGGWAHLNTPMYSGLTVGGIGGMMQEAVNAACSLPSCRWLYGNGDLDGELYLSSGILTDWTQWALGAPSYTIELPPRTEALGGFDPDPSTILEYGGTLFTAVRTMLRGLSHDWAAEEAAAEEERMESGGLAETAEWCAEGDTPAAPRHLRILNRLDLYPREVSWALIGPDEDTLAGWSAEEGGQREGDSATGGSLALCAGIYVFVIRDEAGDGICCDQASGDTSLYADGGLLFRSGGDFGASQIVVIALDGTPVVRLVNESIYPNSPNCKTWFRVHASNRAIDLIMKTLFNTFDTPVDTRHFLLTGGEPAAQPGGTSAKGVITAVAVVVGALAVLVAAGLALSVWHRRRKARELAIVLELRRGHMNSSPKTASHLIAPSRPDSFSQSYREGNGSRRSAASSRHPFNTSSAALPDMAETRREARTSSGRRRGGALELRTDSTRSAASVALDICAPGGSSPLGRYSNGSMRGAPFSQTATIVESTGEATTTTLLMVGSRNGSGRIRSDCGDKIGAPSIITGGASTEAADVLLPDSFPPGDIPRVDVSLLGMPGSMARHDADSGAEGRNAVGVRDSMGEGFEFPVLPAPANPIVWEAE